jgi:hypothetical protein
MGVSTPIRTMKKRILKENPREKVLLAVLCISSFHSHRPGILKKCAMNDEKS